MRAYYIEILTSMRDFCPKIMLLPWNTEKDEDHIKTQLQKYFLGARSRDIGEDVYAKINLAYPVGTEKPTFEEDFQGWCESCDIRFHQTPVQHHNVKGVCWLPYLTRYTNTRLLSEKFTASYAASTKSKIKVPIGCSFRALNGQYDKPTKLRIRAVHVEYPSDYRQQVKKILRACSHQKKYPGGSRFRVMNEYWPYMTEENKKRHRYMVDRHKFFIDQIGTCQTSQLLEVDTKIPGSQLTIRQKVLAIKDLVDGEQIFNRQTNIGIPVLQLTVYLHPSLVSKS